MSYLENTLSIFVFLRLQLEEFEKNDEVNVAPEEVVAEKQTLLTRLHNFEKKEEKCGKKVKPSVKFEDEAIQLEPPKPPLTKVQVRIT